MAAVSVVTNTPMPIYALILGFFPIAYFSAITQLPMPPHKRLRAIDDEDMTPR